MNICDVGCGYGETAKYVAELLHASVPGLTISKKQFENIQQNLIGATNPKFMLHDWLSNEIEKKIYGSGIFDRKQ
jgi:tocopherol O-methyltransferase